jgi:hypothetical protein
MNRFDHQWRKLTTLARQARDERDPAAPYGFASRVAAQAASIPLAGPWAVFERFALRGLMVAAAFGVGAIAFSYSTLMPEQADEYAAADTIGEILDLS